MRRRILKAVTYLVIFFFTWTMGGMFNIAYAAYHEIQKPSFNKKQEQRPEEKFQKAMDDLRNIVTGKTSSENRKSRLRQQRDAIEALNKDIKGQFADTENKLKKAGLPQEILQRHYNFVKNYENNLQELRTNLNAADNAKTDKEFENNAEKIRKHLAKTSFKKSHKPLDPNKLPHRLSDIKRKEPRTKPEEFKKDIKQRAELPRPLWEGIEGRGANPTAVIPVPHTRDFTPALSPANAGGIQKVKNNNQPLLLASNGPLTGLVEKLPKYEESQNLPQPLFTKEGSNKSFDIPPFLKGDKGGFSTRNESSFSVVKDKGGFSNKAESPITLALAHDPPTAADLAQTIDVQLTPAIKAKAAELNYSPVKIYNWVRNNVEYVPTYGSIQGADMCLQTKQGNDFDIASLLIALLRASGIHARYVHGVIELPIDKVMNWVGGFTNANAAISFIASGGTPVVGLIAGGKIASVRMEHVWVEAYVKYYPLRGAKHETGNGDSWIPLDASYKQYTYTQGIDIKSAVPFDAQSFVNQIQSTATIDTANSAVTNINSTYVQQQMQNYQTQVKNYIEQNYPNAMVGDVLGKKEIIKQNFTYLLGTLPYQKAIIGVKYSEIPDSLRHKITFKVTKDIYDEDTGTPINITKRLPDIAGKKITLSYSPATASDEAVIDSYEPKPHADGSPIQPSELSISLPAYLINLKPELRIDGVVVATGTTVGMGYQETFDMVFYSPSTGIDVVSNYINAGAYNAIGLNVSKISKAQLEKLRTNIEMTKNQLQDPNITTIAKDDYIGDLLYLTAITYHSMVEFARFTNAKYMGVNFITLPSEDIFGYPLEVTSSWGVPVLASNKGINMDADAMICNMTAKDGDAKKAKNFMLISGMQSSALENGVPEIIFSTDTNIVDGVSAVKVLKIANDQGIPIYTINQSNINTILPQLQVDENVKADIQNAINSGKEVTISKTNIMHNGWTGCGYIIANPNTGAAGYMISGGLSGAGAFLETFFAAISSFLSESAKIHKDIGISAQRALVYSTITKVLSFVSLGINIGNILANPNLSLTQQILEIICHITAVWASGAIIAAAAGPLGILGGLLASIFISLVITGLLLLAIHCIENCANFRRKSIFYV